MIKRIALFNFLLLESLFAQDLQIKTATDLIVLDMNIAHDKASKEKGFMYRKSLKPKEAILFTFEQPQVVRMWMKNTYISLDMLFVDESGVIVFIHERARPKSLDIITHNKSVKAVIEIAGGSSRKLGIQLGDRVLNSLFSTH